MKRILILLICISPLNSFAGWLTQYSSGNVTDISFPDSLHGWVVESKTGALSKILFTNNSGKIWTEKPTATTAQLDYSVSKICFADSSTGWAGGSWTGYDTNSPWPGTGWLLLSTTNGFNKYNITKFDVISHYQGGNVINMETAACELFWGYWQWDYYTPAPVYINGKCIGFGTSSMSICFIDASRGWVCYRRELFKTTTGVNNLSSLYSFPNINDIDFIDSLHGWAVGDTGKILYTNNGGADSIWNTLTSGVTNNLGCVKFVDSLNGWAGGTGILLRTRDGGQTWASEYSGTVSKICAIDTTYAWALSNGNILKYKPYVGIEEPSNWSEATSRLGGPNLSVSKNPFSKSTTITYHLPANVGQGGIYPAVAVSLAIYNLAGKLVKSFPITQSPNSPITRVTWDGTDNNGRLTKTGIYFVKLTAGNYKETKKLILLK